jgi:hypothetical protein
MTNWRLQAVAFCSHPVMSLAADRHICCLWIPHLLKTNKLHVTPQLHANSVLDTIAWSFKEIFADSRFLVVLIWRQTFTILRCAHFRLPGNDGNFGQLWWKPVDIFAYCFTYLTTRGHAAGGAVGWGTALQPGRSRGRFPTISLEFFLDNPYGRTVALGLSRTLTEMSTRNIFWGKGGRCKGLTTLLPSCADCLEIWEPKPPGTLRACRGL